MPTLPWITVSEPTTPGEVVVMASRLRVRALRHVLPFFLDALRVHAQMRKSDGVVGLSLQANPLRREFATLSAWRDHAALEAAVRAEPHRSVMARQRRVMAGSTFRLWSAPADTLPLTWEEADRRLAAVDKG